MCFITGVDLWQPVLETCYALPPQAKQSVKNPFLIDRIKESMYSTATVRSQAVDWPTIQFPIHKQTENP